MFQSTFTFGQYPVALIEAGVSWLTESLNALIPDGILQDLLVDGIIGGVGGVIVFLPNILILFLLINLLLSSLRVAYMVFDQLILLILFQLFAKVPQTFQHSDLPLLFQFEV